MMSVDNLALNRISDLLQLNKGNVQNVLNLLNDDATVPFIARYRKEQTGGLDESAILNIHKAWQDHLNLIKRKTHILETIEGQGKLTPALKDKINATWESDKLEDIYLPFKKQVKTKATKAIELGLEPLAKIIMSQKGQDIVQQAKRFVRDKVKNKDQAIQGAQDIIAAWINESLKARDIVRYVFERTAKVEAKVVKTKRDEAKNYESYFDFEEPLKYIPSYRLLAVLRGQNEGFLKVKLKVDKARIYDRLVRLFIRQPNSPAADYIASSINDAYKRLLFPSIENEFFKKAKEKADLEAISVFSDNLESLLLAAPLGNKSVLAIDPGFKSGCKTVVLDAFGTLLYNTNIYPHPPQNKKDDAARIVKTLIQKYNIEAIAIGNGTAGKETYHFLSKENLGVDIYFVNESGASFYSASEKARKEFPDKDITVRGAVSIGRRLMDPLSELIKIDPKSIGVGQYQHDVNQKLLSDSLDQTVSLCVNKVGVNLNTASEDLLSYVSGLGPGLAKNIVAHRRENGLFKAKSALRDVKRLGKKAFEQCAGFLRITDGINPLDNTGVHPESYYIPKAIAQSVNLDLSAIINNKSILRNIDPSQYIDDKVGLPTIKDILKELEKPGLDPRGEAAPIRFSDKINTINDLNIGMILPGVINNITQFGAFVDLGIKDSGLLHKSQVASLDNLKLGQLLEVKIIQIDLDKRRIGLSVKNMHK